MGAAALSTEVYGKDGNFYQGVAKESAGFKLLQSMGWKEGDGLGANRQGIKEHVKVKKKFDNSGVGKTEADARVRDWTLGMAAFDRVLSNLTEITSKHASRGLSDDERSDASGGDSAVIIIDRKNRAVNEKRKGAEERSLKRRRAEQQQGGGKEDKAGGVEEGKDKDIKKRNSKRKSVTFAQQAANSKQQQPAAESKSASDDASSGGNSGSSGRNCGSDEEQRPARPPPRRVVSHIGRFKRREASKSVRNYSSTDLAAIVGVIDGAGGVDDAPFQALAAVELVRPKAAAISDHSSSGEDESEGAAGTTSSGGARQQLGARRGRGSTLLGSADPPPASEGKPLWWVDYFVQAGRLGAASWKGIRGSKAARGFNEDDQVALYTLNKDLERCGRQGLGVKGQPKKVAGARWAGTKVKLDSDAEEGEEEEEQDSDEEGGGMREDAVHKALGGIQAEGVVILPPLRQQQRQQQQGTAAADPAPEPGKQVKKKKKTKEKANVGSEQAPAAAAAPPPSTKWKKLASAVLQGAPGKCLQLGKLQRRTLRAAGLLPACASSNIQLLAALTGSSRFVVDGNLVRFKGGAAQQQ